MYIVSLFLIFAKPFFPFLSYGFYHLSSGSWAGSGYTEQVSDIFFILSFFSRKYFLHLEIKMIYTILCCYLSPLSTYV